jgi:aerobic C4-dicarboxylate transport protein
MSEMRSLVNLVGNGVATIVVSRWEGQFDATRASYVLSREYSKAEDEHQLRDTVATM